jgi:CMP/dCMP kinase
VSQPLIIALDGPAGAGKSTVAALLAARVGVALVDTGAIYRTLALLGARSGIDLNDEAAVLQLAKHIPTRMKFQLQGGNNRVWLDDSEDISDAIRQASVSTGASTVSRHPQVRAALLQLQRELGRQGTGAVLEGRDIGTVVFPDATLKAFVTATPQERARRRMAEYISRGILSESYDKVLADIKARDEQDQNRAVAPLKPAADAVIVDTTGKSLVQVVDELAAHVERIQSLPR